jgi:GT2 family glycosyltransferase
LIEYVRVEVNVGASGGFGIGMETAMARGADWIWGMDDDAFPHPEALERLLAANPYGEHDCLWSNVDEDIAFDGPTKQVNVLIFVGYLVSRRLVENVGYPDRRFYMYHDDTDYSKRIFEKEFSILKVRDSVIDHKGFNKRGTPLTTYKLPVGSFTVLNCEPFRIYYIFRNMYFIKGQGVERFRYVLRNLLIEFPKYLLARPWSGVAIGLATFHALINRRGRVDLPSVFSRKYY